jgi:FlaG protein
MVTKIDGAVSLFVAPLPGKLKEPPKPESPPQNTGAAPARSVEPAYGFQLRVDQETREVTAIIIDQETRAIIREIPAKEMNIASDVIRNLVGPLIDKTV